MTPHECPDDELCVACIQDGLAACCAELLATSDKTRRAELTARIEELTAKLELEGAEE
jgi:hypothetical protein